MNQRLDWHDWLMFAQDILRQAFGLAGFRARTFVGVPDGVSGDNPRHDFHEQLFAYAPD